jgi:hypothetical protein
MHTNPVRMIIARSIGSILFSTYNWSAYIPRQNERIAFKGKSYTVVEVHYIYDDNYKLEEVHVIVND